MKIVPTVLTDNIEIFKSQMKTIEKFSDEVDIDVMDGTLFGTNQTPLLRDMLLVDSPLVRHLHLMIKEPADAIKLALDNGIRSVVVHAEADLEWLNFDEIPIDIGIAIAPQTPVMVIEAHLKTLSSVQIMTVDPGAQGRVFLQDQLKKIPELRAMGFAGEIKVDGGVSEETIQDVEKAGADVVYVGSAIWKSENPEETYKTLQEITQNN